MVRSNAVMVPVLLALWVGAPLVVEAAPKKAAAAKKPDPKTARPGDQQATTKGLEEALKKSGAAEEETRTAPAKIDVQVKEVSRDAKADKARDEAIEQIKKILPKQRNPEVRADLLFQLAELWWEKSRFVKLAEEMPAYQSESDKWDACAREKGRDACGAEPKPNHRKSELYRKNAVDLYGQVIKEYPSYRRIDEVRFILAYNKYDLAGQLPEDSKARRKLQLEAIDQYQKLIALHPKSEFVSDAWVELGNFFFDGNKLTEARKSFESCVRLKRPKTETYCIYKLAWCDINSGDHETAVKRFKEVIARADKEDDRIKLKSEALNDIIVPFSQLELRDAPIKYFQEKAGRQGSRRYIVKLANVYFDAGKYDTAIWMFRYMMGELPKDPNAPEWQSKVVLAYDKAHKRDEVLKEMRKLVDNYRPGSPWWKANERKQGVRGPQDVALALTEEALYNLVTDYHQEAIKTKSVATYRLARDIYKEYIDNFPDTERTYQMRFYYAEILFALEEFQKAYDQYIVVATFPDAERDDYRKVSATNMLLSAEKLLKIETGEEKLTISSDAQKIEEGKNKGTIADKKLKIVIDKTAKEQPLTQMETQLVAACDRYIELVPDAPDEARVRLRAAIIFFDRIQYVKAAQRFGYIIKRWPEEKTSATAAQLILESLEVKEEWASLNDLARQFSKNDKLLAGRDKDEFRKKLAVYIEGSAFKYASEINDEKKDYPQAARLFRDFVTEFPKSRYSPIGLYNAFVIYQRAKELDTAIAMGEQLLADYGKDCDSDEMRTLPGSGDKRPPILPLLVFDLGKAYEQIADFATAARYYEKFAADFPADDRAADSQFNAGLWYQGLGEAEKAITAFEKYIKVYDAKKPDERTRLKLVPAASVAFQIALIHEGRKDWKKTLDQLDRYLKVYPSEAPWKRQSARYKKFLAYRELADAKLQAQIADQIVEAAEKELKEEDAKKDSSKLAIAHVRFYKLEPRFEEYTKLRFDSPRTLAADLKKKIDAMGAMKAAYEKVVGEGNGDWAIASLVRMAMLPKLFAKSLLEAPIPKGLDEEQQELYRATLEEKALEFEEPAISALELALSKSFELTVYNEWTLEAERLLAEFKPDYYTEIKRLPLKGSEFFFSATPMPAAPAAVPAPAESAGAGGGGDGR